MAKYFVTYCGGEQPATPEDGARHMEKWKAWLAAMGEAVVNPGTPLKDTKTVSVSSVSDYEGTYPFSGFSVLEADNLDAVLRMVRSCPFLDTGGTMDVSEMIEMQM